jgi:hypothetical protein
MNNPNKPKAPVAGKSTDGQGLTISSKIHNEYGEEFKNNQVDRAGAYAGCINCCGTIPKVLCCVCAACNCGPVRMVSTG